MADRLAFPSTQWSRILSPDGERTRESVGALIERYWRPIHATIRARFRVDDDEAKDLTQGFMLWILECDLLDRADPSRGRFRSFVRTALIHYVTDRIRGARADKRGGGKVVVSFAATGADPADDGAPTPDQVLDREWRRELVSAALRDVERAFIQAGKVDTYQLFHDYFIAGEEGVDYRALAARYGVGLDDVSNRLRRAKELYRSALRRRVMDTVTNADELREELAWLFGREERK